MTEKEEGEIIERYLTGESNKSLSNYFDRTTDLITNILRRNGIEIRPKRLLGKICCEKSEKNIRKLPSKEDILFNFFYKKEDGALINKRTLKRGKPDFYGYRTCSLTSPNGDRIRYKEHRLIYFLETSEEPEQVDHIDGNILNNHISNLRSATRGQNRANSSKKAVGKSKYKGVWKYEKNKLKPWGASIRSENKSYFLGLFQEEADAARAYNEAAIKLHKEFARLNIIEEDL